VVEAIAAAFGIEAAFEPAEVSYLVPGKSASVTISRLQAGAPGSTSSVGVIGQIQPAILEARGFPANEALWAFELDAEALALRQGSGQAAERPWSPLQVLGRSSLFIYWIHVELVYGLVSLPLHGAFSLAGAWAALGVFSLLMLAAAVAKDRTIGKFKRGNTLRNQPGRAAQPLMF